MNNYITFFQSLLVTVLLCFSTTVFSQVQVTTDRPDAYYEAGESMNFVVNANASGTATYAIHFDAQFTPAITTGTVQINTGQPASIPFTLNEANTVLCRVTLNGQQGIAGAAFSPFEIAPYEDDPADFEAFWDGWKAQLALVPIDPVIEPLFPDPSPNTDDYKINLGQIDGRRIYGYLSIPRGNGPFPAVIYHTSFGFGPNLCIPLPEITERLGAITFSMWMHDTEPTQFAATAYQPEIFTDKDEIYYRYGVLGIIRAIDYLETRPDYDGSNLGLFGVSEGGGVSILAAGVDDRVKALAASIFALSEHTGYRYDRASGFPYFLRRTAGTFPPVPPEVVTEATAYYDAVRAAKRYDGPFLGAVGYVDETCFPSTVFSAFNQFRGPSVMIHKLDGPHRDPQEFRDMRFDFARTHLTNTSSGNTTYLAEAGPDQTITSTAVLDGSLTVNGVVNTTLPVRWKMISGPGTVVFQQPNQRSTTATFSEPGTYVLRLLFDDKSPVQSDRVYYSATDHLTITNTGPCTLQGQPCDDGDNCTTNDAYDDNCLCAGTFVGDADNDGVCDAEDVCPQGDDNVDSDGDGLADACDPCPSDGDCWLSLATLNDVVLDCSDPQGMVVSWDAPVAERRCTDVGTTYDCTAPTLTGYTYLGAFNGSQYYYSSTPASWAAARAQAQQNNADLAVFEDADERAYIASILQPQAPGQAWIGLSDAQNESNFTWVNGVPNDCTSCWKPFQPNDGQGSEDYVYIDFGDGLWDDGNGDWSFPSLIELPCTLLNDTTVTTLTAQQITGPASGSRLTGGLYTVAYAVGDSCIGMDTTSFEINISPCGMQCDLMVVPELLPCSQNGTPFDPADDRWGFTLVATNGAATDFELSLGDSTQLLNYGTVYTFDELLITDGPVLVTVTDRDDSDCKTTFTMTPPPACSAPCVEPAPFVIGLPCDDNNTPTDPLDDTWGIAVGATGGDTTTYQFTGDGLSAQLTYGDTVVFDGLAIADGRLDLIFTDLRSDCLATAMIDPPATCSDSIIPPMDTVLIDLELGLDFLTTNEPPQFSDYSLQLRITNRGPSVATGVQIRYDLPTGSVFQGGNVTSNMTDGAVSVDTNGLLWILSSLDSGAVATVDLNLFRLVKAEIQHFAQVTAAGEDDLDSEPNNGACCLANEDDEAVTAAIETLLSSTVDGAALDLEVRLSPNPNSGVFMLQWNTSSFQAADIQLFNSLGQSVANWNNVPSGHRFENTDLSAGVYWLVLQTENGPAGVQKMVIE